MGQGHILDANTFALWRMDEPGGGDLLDATDGGRTLAASYGTSQVRSYSLISQYGRHVTGGQAMTRASDLALRTVLRGDYTLEFWSDFDGRYPGDWSNIFLHNIGDGAGTNGLCLLLINPAFPRRLLFSWWDADGVGNDLYAATALPEFGTRHIAVRVKTVAGITRTVDFFINGVLDISYPGKQLAGPDAQYSGGHLRMWSWPSGPRDFYFGHMADFRLSSVARSDEEILESFNRGFSSGIVPTVTVVSPAVTEGISSTTPIVVDVTQATALISASFPGLSTYEVVHDGTSFAPAYAALSSRTAITGGFRYTLLRQQGWPASPRIIATGIT